MQCCTTIFSEWICVSVRIFLQRHAPLHFPRLDVIPPPLFLPCIYLVQHDFFFLFFSLCVCSHWIQTTLTLTLNAMFSGSSKRPTSPPEHLRSSLLMCVFFHVVIPICSFRFLLMLVDKTPDCGQNLWHFGIYVLLKILLSVLPHPFPWVRRKSGAGWMLH